MTVFSHRVHPRLEPVHVDGADIVDGLQGKAGGIAVSSVAQSFDVGAVDHVAAEDQVVHRVGNHVVDPVQIGIGTVE